MPQATTVNTFLTGATKKNFMLGAAQPNLGTRHQPCLIKQVQQQHQPGDTSHQAPSSFLPLSLHAKPRPTCCQAQSPNCYTSAKNLIMPKHNITQISHPQFVANTTQSTQPICHPSTPSSKNHHLQILCCLKPPKGNHKPCCESQATSSSSSPPSHQEMAERENEKEIEDVNWERLWLRRRIILY